MSQDKNKEALKGLLREYAVHIRKFQAKNGHSAHWISQAAGVDPHSVYSILRQEGNPTAETLTAIGAAIGVRLTVDDIGHLE